MICRLCGKDKKIVHIGYCKECYEKAYKQKWVEKGNPKNPEKEYHHIRIKDPNSFDSESFRVIAFDKGIKATIGCPKGQFQAGTCQTGTQIQKLLFPKETYSKKEALEWVKKHPKLKLRKK